MTLVATNNAQIDRQAVLRELGLDVSRPAAQAVILICERYDLDPLLKHMVLIQQRPYITRDGYLHIAHRSKQFDGLDVVETGETQSHWWAKVAVHRKDMGHPFTFVGRYPKSGGNKAYGPEMAIKCAEVAALRRAFDVSGIAALDEAWDAAEIVDVPAASLASPEQRELIRGALAALDTGPRAEMVAELRETFGPADQMPASDVDLALDMIDAAAGLRGTDVSSVVSVGGRADGTGSAPSGDAPDPSATPDHVEPFDGNGSDPGEGAVDPSRSAAPSPDIARNVGMWCADAGIGDDLRPAFLFAFSSGAFKSAHDVPATELGRLRETLDEVRRGVLTLVVDPDGARAPQLVGEGSDSPESSSGPAPADVTWRAKLGQRKGAGQAKLLRRARDLATERGLDAPTSLEMIPPELNDELDQWLDGFERSDAA